jgi:hypothetical protein
MCDRFDAIDFWAFGLSNVAQDPTCKIKQIDQNLLPTLRSNGILMPNGLKVAKVIATEYGKFIDPSGPTYIAMSTRAPL